MTDKEIETRKHEIWYFGKKMTKEEETEYAELCVRDMVNSCMCYGGKVSNNDRKRYFTDADKILKRCRVDEIIADQTQFFQEHAHVNLNVMTDSEGCSYNSINWC